jgi:beta-barrel assembly-enhancing protease
MPSIWAPSDRMAPAGRFYDGRSSARHEVTLSLDLAALCLVLTDSHGEVDRWPLDEIRLVERPVPGFPVRYRRADRDGPRLTGGDDSLLLLRSLCPNLSKTPPRERRSARLAFWIGAAAFGLIGLVIFSLPYFAHELAIVFPPKLEQKIGLATDQTIRTLLGGGTPVRLCQTRAGHDALDRLAYRLAAAAGMENPPHIEVVDTPVLNALALPGNRVLVFRGLIDKAPDGNALAGVLGHEFGHIAYRHPLEAAIRQSGLSLLIGLLVGDVYGGSVVGGAALVLLNSAYSREAEEAADRAALKTLAAARIDSDGMAKFFHMIGQEERKSGGGGWPTFTMSHPDTGDREAMIRQEGHPGGLAMPDADWRRVKAICDDD